MSNSIKPVVIVGAGFAGLVAARELESAGIDCVIYEAKDRIGGRAWTADRMGHQLELGATWVHWFQPHIWTEIMRYGQRKNIIASPTDNDAYWVTEGNVISGTESELDALLEPTIERLFENSKDFFPNPFDPLHVISEDYSGPTEMIERFRAADLESPLDCLRDGTFTQEQIDLADAFWAAGYIGDPDTGSSLMAKQWGALSDHSFRLMEDITLKWKLTNGMRSLYEGIASDLRAPIHLNTPVTAIEHTDSGSRVTIASGESVDAAAVICTVPVGALNTIEFRPGLPAPIQEVVNQKWNSQGCKIWLKIKGHHKILGYAPKPAKISILRSEVFCDDDTTICVGFGFDHNRIDLNSLEDAQEVLNQWRPDLEVVDTCGHDWVADKWAGQAWGTLRKGQFTNGWSRFDEIDTRLFFAGSDYANGWRGVVVDGALEKGMLVARSIVDLLR